MYSPGVSSDSIDALYSVSSDRWAQMSSLAQTALSQGADLYTKGKYDQAVVAFKRSIALDPSADNAPQAYNLLATTYIKQNKTDDAIKAYKASLLIYPNDENAHVKLGNIYYSQKNYVNAEKEYKAAIGINPTSSTDLYSLGQVYLASGRTADAEKTFKQVIRVDPAHHAGYYALGQTYSKEGRTKEAIEQFQHVLRINRKFYDAYVDLGSAYADLGQMDKAQEQVTMLKSKASNLVSLLTGYIDKVLQPKIVAALSNSGFNASLGLRTTVASLDSSLATANSSKAFSMFFSFNKDMDSASVQNTLNWSISKANGRSTGGAYDWGLTPPQTDIRISPIPLSVVYEQDTHSAIVTFKIQQNASADGTIDPSHILFQFSGKDAYKNAMDPKADQYSGISSIV
jgi:tetratricopeptide (TPR) repeat protein